MTSPRIRFGLAAAELALRAQTGRVPPRDVDRLADLCERLLPQDGAAKTAVLLFSLEIEHAPRSAGRRFAQWLRDWAPPRTPAHAWQFRADAGLE